MTRVQELVAAPAPPAAEEITNAFWCACHGGQRATAEYLLDQGADISWIGHDNLTPLDVAARSDAHHLVDGLQARGAKTAAQLR
jgi:ankyrin repeat protein